MKKLRIAQVVSLQESIPPKGKNGLEFMVYYLTEELVKRGHEVTLFATANSKTNAKLISILPYPAAKKRLLNWGCVDYSLISMVEAAKMSKNFDLIHTHIGPIAFYFSDFIKVPIIETIHSPVYALSKKYMPPEKIMRKYINDKIRRYKKNFHIFVSENQKKNSFIKNNNFVVHNGIDLRQFKFKNSAEDYFLFLGYITPDKGAHLAVKAVLKAKVKLKLAGSYKYCEKYFKQEIKPHLRKRKVEYVGIVNPVQRNRLLGRAKAILVPVQWEEPFGLVMIEAMACGTPVIGFNRAAVPEIVKDGKTGFVVNDIKGIVRAIKRIDEINREDCRKHVEENFTVQKMADEYEKVYEKAINSFKAR